MNFLYVIIINIAIIMKLSGGLELFPLFNSTLESKKLPKRNLRPAEVRPDEVVRNYFDNGGKIKIVIFYGRNRHTRIQLPYLLQNRRMSNEAFDESRLVSTVTFLLNTGIEEDIMYVKNLVKKEPNYFKLQTGVFGLNYCSFYSHFNESKVLYLKMDDDIIYVHPKAVLQMAFMKLTTNFLFVSANIVNHAAISAKHLMFAVFQYDTVASAVHAEEDKGFRDLKYIPHPPYKFEGDAWGDHSWRSGRHALLQHILLFHYMRINDLDIYKFGQMDFDAKRYYRWSINCFMFLAEDLKHFNLAKCGTNDELYLSMFYPHELNKHSGACGDALVSHFAYYIQRDFLEKNTSVLKRYREVSKNVALTLSSSFDHLLKDKDIFF